MRPLALLVATVLLATAAAAQDKPPKGEAEASAKKVKELQTERIVTLKAVVETSFQLARRGRLEVREVSEARMTLLKAELDAAEKGDDRLTLLKEAADALKQYEALAKAAHEAGRATDLDRLAIKAKRLEVEIQLEQAKQRAARDGK